MNLYKIMFTHYAQRGSEDGIKTYLLASSDDDVYTYINKTYMWGTWEDRSQEDGMVDVLDDDWNIIGTETYREKMIRIRGDMHDDDYELSDLYYGCTLFGWELVAEVCGSDLIEAIELGVVTEYEVA